MEFNINRKLIYYISISIVGIAIFAVIFSNYAVSDFKKESKMKVQKGGYLLESVNHLGRGKKEFEAHQGYYVRDLSKQYFACKDCDNEAKLCFSLKGNKYMLFYLKGKSAILYSQGFRVKHEQYDVYDLKSAPMTAREGYYRFSKIPYAGTFTDITSKKRLKDWSKVFIKDEMREEWKLVEKEGNLVDMYSGTVFHRGI